MTDVLIIGAGLQGVCVAMALSGAGHRLRIVDQAPEPMTRASLRNEGKIHLGFTYANDPSGRTAELCLQTATEFADLIDGWLPEAVDWDRLRSRPFTYLVMRDSLVAPHEISATYARLGNAYDKMGRPPYLGEPIDSFVREIAVPSFVSADHVDAAFETPEVALDFRGFRSVMVDPFLGGAEWIPNRRVTEVAERVGGYEVHGVSPGGERWTMRCEVIVNCSWEGRLALDEQVGLLPAAPPSYRLKYRVLARLPRSLSDLPSITMVLGPYGDIVPMAASYLSWYPLCLKAWSNDTAPPQQWQRLIANPADVSVAEPLAAGVLAELDKRVPGIGQSEVIEVDAGVVVARGTADIDEPTSGLHSRDDAGIFGGDGYFSIDTGKLGFAPRFAAELASRL